MSATAEGNPGERIPARTTADDGCVIDPDVAVVGDGPAGLAIASACARAGLRVRVYGQGRPWEATYATWRDEVPMVPESVFTSITDPVDVVGAGGRRHRLDRPYAVFDNEALRAHLLSTLPDDTFVGGEVDASDLDPGRLGAGVVVAATGASVVGDRPPTTGGPATTGSPATTVGSATPWQTAYGAVLDEVPASLDLDPAAVTLMDWRQADGTTGPPSFCYVVPVHDGWLVEETVLAAAPAVEPSLLRQRLVSRLGPQAESVLAAARRVEEVRIPMGLPRPSSVTPGVIPFGAAAGLIHPATGYSVAASLRAAPRVAAAIAVGTDPWEALWPRPYRRARTLHDYGLAALLRLDADDTGAFFDAFFEMPVDRWSAYLRVDVTPRQLAGVMSRVFRRAPWRVRRRLMAGDPRVVLRLLAAS